MRLSLYWVLTTKKHHLSVDNVSSDEAIKMGLACVSEYEMKV